MNRLRQWKAYRRRLPPGRWGYWIGLVRVILSRYSSPESVALGFAVGVWVAFLPVIGVQMVLAALLATALKANAVVAAAMVWISNPLTFTPLFAFTYRVGILFVDGPSVNRVREQLASLLVRLDRHALFDLPAQAVEWMKIGRDTFVALLIGGAWVGLLGALVSYPIVLRLVRRYRARRDESRRRRRVRRMRAASGVAGVAPDAGPSPLDP